MAHAAHISAEIFVWQEGLSWGVLHIARVLHLS